MNNDSDNHVSAELKILGLFEGESTDVGHKRIEEQHIDHDEYLHCCDGRVEVDSYFSIGEDIIEDGLIDDKAINPILNFVHGDIEGIELARTLSLIFP